MPENVLAKWENGVLEEGWAGVACFSRKSG